MMKSRTAIFDQAYILHARKYRNTSLILHLLTREQGRYSVVVKGARDAGSKLRGRLQPFTPLLVASLGKSDLKTATSIDFPGPAFRLLGKQLLLGLYSNELLYRLLGHFDPAPKIFDEYELLLDALQQAPASVAPLRCFELMLLQELGYGINFEHEVSTGEPLEADGYYHYVVAEGFYKAPTSAKESMRGAELIRIGTQLTANDVQDSHSSRLTRHFDSRQLRNITRQSLRVLLGDKPVKSRSLFRHQGS